MNENEIKEHAKKLTYQFNDIRNCYFEHSNIKKNSDVFTITQISLASFVASGICVIFQNNKYYRKNAVEEFFKMVTSFVDIFNEEVI